MKDGNTHEQVTTYTYDSSGRLGTVADATDTFTYGYLLESNLVETLTSPAHTVTNTYETSRNVLDTKKNEVGSTLVSGYDYTVNDLGQRTDLSQTGTAFATARSIAWGYDSLGQATKADSSIPGLDRAYEYDMIGNRLKSADSLTLPANNNYTVNVLNQYTAVDSNSPTYDDDGNATAYPLPAHLTANSTLVWDAENRLTGATVSGIATSYAYDSQSRRIATVTGATTTLTIYDGWNPITKYSGATLDEAYLWGMDLSGSMQGAGGVAGLLSVNDGNASYYPTYDGNGNVSEYLNSAGSVQAHYEYDPFGKTTVATGTKAQDFAHRFSTKPLDTETGLYYYGYRYYDPVTGRWPSRDPIGERGGVNLYGFVGNDGVNWWDYLGMKISIIGSGSPKDPEYTPATDKDLLDTLAKLRECCPEIAKYWDELEASKNHHIIENKRKRNRVRPRGGMEPATNGEGTGSSMELTGLPGELTLGDGSSTPLTSLAHELQHAYDIDRGSLEKDSENGSGGVSKAEENAVRAENVCRKKLGLPIRTTYGGQKVDDPEATPQ